MSKLKKALIRGTIWSTLGQLSSLLITLGTNIWLARLLSPEEFGQLGIIMFFIMIANVLTESGLGGALVRKKKATRSDYSTVFVTNLIFSVFCYLLLIIGSGAIANFYEDAIIKDLLIVAGLVLIINSFQLTQNAKLISELKFKEKSIYRFIAVVISSSIGVYLAYSGFGVWSLIAIQLIAAGVNTILLWMFEGFFMRFYFSKASFKELYSFGINTTLASILNKAFDNIYQLILGKYFSISETGYFYQAKRLQDVPGGVINMLSQSVVFSSLAKLQDDKIAFTKVYNKITLYFIIMLGFISSFIYVYAEQIILLLYGSEWVGAIFYMKLLTIGSFFFIQEQINRVIFKVFNQTRKILYLEYVKKTIQSISIVIGVIYLSLQVLIIGFVITNIIGYLINFYYSRKVIGNVSIYELKTLFKIICLSVVVVIIVILFGEMFNLQKNYFLYTIPLLIGSYLIGLKMLKIINIKTEFKKILSVRK
ncbi:MAG TPA: lipopolysaccharide biosynthesis protein [Gallicola sp.]|nr:lipopolysaccharide biosynthesis protein [Gallicola sp.]